MMYRDEDGRDYRCANGHLVRLPKDRVPVRCPVVDGGWCEAATFVVVDAKIAERERAGIRARHRGDARYDR